MSKESKRRRMYLPSRFGEWCGKVILLAGTILVVTVLGWLATGVVKGIIKMAMDIGALLGG
ncbi:MAG TPA: hypothetical protein VMW24_25020 [Sedimentisphaerales bacterium]|nr:hypothetical protein [Sedimentisphaerales bacterium]